MAEQRADQDASEPATAFKLEKAHERGSIVRSGDLTFALVLMAGIACVYGLGTQVMDGTALLIRGALGFVARDGLTSAAAFSYLRALGSQALVVITPVIFAIWVSALVSGSLQARGVFTTQPLKPDLARLNPANGIKRLASIKSLFELLRSCVKVALIGGGMAMWGRYHLRAILRLQMQNPRTMAHSGIALFGSALILLTALMLLFALFEWSFNRWDFMRQMRMSKREIKDEHKEREGDPRIKRRLRELRIEWLKRTRQLSKVRRADVVLTNPTHYAVALEYRHGEMPAPLITARGAGEIARRMRAEAHRYAIPVVENPPLARALFALDDSQLHVPEEHFDQVARVLRWVYAARGTRAS
jgi:flagellar biosynthetic protein FlhB